MRKMSEENQMRFWKVLFCILLLVLIGMLVALRQMILNREDSIAQMYLTEDTYCHSHPTELQKNLMDTVGELTVYDGETVDDVGVATALRTGAGSGFFAYEEGLFVTAHHVVEGCYDEECDHLRIYAGEEKKYKYTDAEVVATNSEKDIALIKINGEFKGKLAEIGSSKRLRAGDPVFSICSPDSYYNIISDGHYIGKSEKYAPEFAKYCELYGEKDYSFTFLISTKLWQGASGGAIFNEKGEVIGVLVSAAYDDNNGIVPIEYVDELYKEYKSGHAHLD